MNNLLKLEIEGIPNAYVIISFRKSDTPNGIKTNMSFFLDNGNGTGVEFEPEDGPFTLIESCEADHPNAKPHWFFPYYTGRGTWGQQIVDDSRISNFVAIGDYASVFAILRNWAGVEA